MIRAALVIAARVLRQRARDRTAFIFSIATPLGLAVGSSNRVFVASLNTGVVEAYGLVPGVTCVAVTSGAASDDGVRV